MAPIVFNNAITNNGNIFTIYGSGSVTIGGSSSAFLGSYGGTGGLTMFGYGTLTLNGAAVNTYTVRRL